MDSFNLFNMWQYRKQACSMELRNGMGEKMKIKRSNGEKIFDVILICFMVIFCFTTLYPFIYLLSLSLTPTDISTTTLRFFTPEITFKNYIKVFESDNLVIGFINTLKRVALGTSVQLIAILGCAYALSKRYFPHRNFWTTLIVFTMYFSGGLIPTYLLIKNLNLINNIWVYVLPGLVPTFTMMIVRNFFMALPDSLEESAKIDGANDITILLRIIIPVSMPIIATVLLWQIVGHWNAWFDCMVYMKDRSKAVLMLTLRRVLLEGTEDLGAMAGAGQEVVRSESLKAAITMIVVLPIICVYPFLQKYFVKGIMVGSLKG